jgi:hypothetical protein
MPNPRKKFISQNILSVFAGGLTSILLHFGLIYISRILFSPDAEPSEFVIAFILFIIPALIGGFVTRYFFVNTNFIHNILAAVVFLAGFIYPELSNIFIEIGISKQTEIFLFKVGLIILFAGVLGGYIGFRIRKRKPTA